MYMLNILNLPIEATEQDVKTHIEECGTVLEVTIPKDRDTGESRGLALVQVGNRNTVQNAMANLDRKEFMGNTIRILEQGGGPRNFDRRW